MHIDIIHKLQYLYLLKLYRLFKKIMAWEHNSNNYLQGKNFTWKKKRTIKISLNKIILWNKKKEHEDVKKEMFPMGIKSTDSWLNRKKKPLHVFFTQNI